MLIKDKMLAETIARSLHKDKADITADDLKSIKEIHARGMDIQTLDGLEYCENLSYLDLSGNRIEVLNALHDLRNLEVIDLSKNLLRDITALHDFRNLKRLNLSRNNLYVMDISAINTMINLEELNLDRCKVDSITYLEGCHRLQRLWLGIEGARFPFGILGTLKELRNCILVKCGCMKFLI